MDEKVNGEAQSQSDDDETSSGSGMTWIHWFCSRDGYEFFCKVSEDFICDNFNLTGLSSDKQLNEQFRVNESYREAINLITDVLDGDEPASEYFSDPNYIPIQKLAEALYGLIHQRFILTKPGLAQMSEKYRVGDFGCCPRVCCNRAHVVPIGLSNQYGQSNVRLFCPKCLDIYTPPSRRHAFLDGSFFGTSMANLLFMTYPNLLPDRLETIYIPRIYGFKVHSTAVNPPRAQKFLRGSSRKDAKGIQKEGVNTDKKKVEEENKA